MPSSSPIALAYSIDDRDLALALEKELGGVVTFQHFSVDNSNEGAILSEVVAPFRGFLFLLVSDAFLKNPNCMLHANRLLTGGVRETKAVLINGSYFDETLGEVVEVRTSLDRQSDIMSYINHWQARYLDLRRQRKALEAEIGPQFTEYLGKIREVSGQVNDFLHYLKDSMPLRMAELEANNYQQFFLFIEDEEAGRRYAASRKIELESEKEVEAEIDVATIPGMDLLAGKTEELTSDEAELEDTLSTEVEEIPVTTTPLVEEAEEIVEVEAESSPAAPDPPIEEEPSPVAIPPATEDISEEDEAMVYIRRAWALIDKDDPRSALDLIKSGREALPESKELHYYHAFMLAAEMNDPEGSRQQLNTLLAIAPDYPDALFLNGELYHAKGKFLKARDTWEHLSDLSQNYPDLNYQLGMLIADHFPEDGFDAATYLRRAVKEGQQDADLLHRYGMLLKTELERPKKAIKMLQKAVKIDPDHAQAHYNLALLYHEQGDMPAANAAYVRAKTLDAAFSTPDNEKAFTLISPWRKSTMMTELESGALSALKDNVAQLEALLQQREDEALAAAELAKAEALNNRPGSGKTMMISGATSGIGLATARRFAAAGYRLILTGRRADRLKVIKTELEGEHETEVHTLVFDVRERKAVAKAVESLPKKWTSIDILLNNAGKAKGFDPIHTGNLDHWDEMIDTNLKGLLYLTRAVSPGMVERQQGMIINLCSTAGKEVYANGNVYCATKHAVDALTESMRIDLVKHGIRVGQVCPAHVEETEFALVRFDGDTDRAEKVYENFQPLTSPDVAEAIYFMANQPSHVNILDLVLQGKQQASSSLIDRSGRNEEE